MTPAEKFKDFLGSLMSPVLKGQGFKRKGQSFYLKRDGNVGLVNFQKSRSNDADALRFTVNVGAASARLSEFFKSRPPDVGLAPDDCHWQQRLGFLLPERRDEWWTITAATDVVELAEEFRRHLCDAAVPEVTRHLDDEALRDLWLAGYSPGLTKLQRLLNLSVLLKLIGPAEKLEEVAGQLLREVEDQPAAPYVMSHLKRLGVRPDA